MVIVLSAAVFIAGFFIAYKNSSEEREMTVTTEIGRQINDVKKWETKTDNQANVTVTVTPLGLSPQSAEWKFEVALDTHSGSLDQDMAKSAVLTDDQGGEYKPVAWDGSPPGGHHRSGVLTFGAVTPAPRSVTLVIRQVGGIKERKFEWITKP